MVFKTDRQRRAVMAKIGPDSGRHQARRTKAMQLEQSRLKDMYRGLRDDYHKLTTSDLQSVIAVKAKRIAVRLDVSDPEYIENILLEYASGNMDLGTAQNFLLEGAGNPSW